MPTTLLDDPAPEPGRRKGTTLVGAGSGTRLVTPTEATSTGAARDRSDDPVVGWLVVLDGPGRGSAVELGYGMNVIGRGEGNRVSLDFGDEQISSEDHFRIAYDQVSRDFHLIPGKGSNLLYIAGKALLTPEALTAMTDIRVGSTTLRFVPLCTAAWDWSMQVKGG